MPCRLIPERLGVVPFTEPPFEIDSTDHKIKEIRKIAPPERRTVQLHDLEKALEDYSASTIWARSSCSSTQ